MYPRTNIAPFEEKSNANPVMQVEDALRKFARQEGPRHEPENTTQVVPDLNSLIQRVTGDSLSHFRT